MAYRFAILLWLMAACVFSSCVKEYSQEGQEVVDIPEGVLSVWSRSQCDAQFLRVFVGDSVGEIRGVHSSQPDCGDGSAAVFHLTYGTYELSAVCGSDTVRQTVVIGSDCVFAEVVFPVVPDPKDYLPLGLNSYWEYADEGNAGVTQIFEMDGEEQVGGRMYTRLKSTRGEVYYFRKDPPNYYQYRLLGFQDFVEDPPPVELNILRDDLPKGAKWETEPVDLIISDVVQKVKLVFTIVDRDYSDTYNGVVYNDLIKVRMELFFSPDGIGFATSGSAYTTVFAKGKGIVSYNDLDININWGIKNLQVFD